MRRRCQRSTVPGVISRWVFTGLGRCRINPARIARSAQSSRGLGFPRRSTATSCRNTNSSASFAALPRASSTSQPTSRTRIRYSNRSDTVEDSSPLTRSPIGPGHRPVPTSGTPQRCRAVRSAGDPAPRHAGERRPLPAAAGRGWRPSGGRPPGRLRPSSLRDAGPAEHHGVVLVQQVVAVRHMRADEVAEPR